MLQRCLNPNHPRFDDYGGRGIGPTEDWLRFENFFADRGDPPPGLSLDRVDNDGPYSASNTHWATHSEQMRNRRPRKNRIKPGDPKILAGLKQYVESLARAAGRGAP
jgi:hypothetical protein